MVLRYDPTHYAATHLCYGPTHYAPTRLHYGPTHYAPTRMALRCSYGMSGTGLAYAATRSWSRLALRGSLGLIPLLPYTPPPYRPMHFPPIALHIDNGAWVNPEQPSRKS
eukprot:2882866-Rhodomonas_salina.1